MGSRLHQFQSDFGQCFGALLREGPTRFIALCFGVVEGLSDWIKDSFFKNFGFLCTFSVRILLGIERRFEDYRIVVSRFGGLFADAAVRMNMDPVIACGLRHNLREPIPPFAADCRTALLGSCCKERERSERVEVR